MENPLYIISVVILWLLWFLVYKIKKINKEEKLIKKNANLKEIQRMVKGATFRCPKCSKVSGVVDLSCRNCSKHTLELVLSVPDREYLHGNISGLLKCNNCLNTQTADCPSCRCLIDKSFYEFSLCITYTH